MNCIHYFSAAIGFFCCFTTQFITWLRTVRRLYFCQIHAAFQFTQILHTRNHFLTGKTAFFKADAINKVILGVGINVNATAKDFPPDLRKQSTSLRIETGNPFHRPPLMAELLNSLDRNYLLWSKEGLNPFLPLLRERLLLVGKKIKVKSLGNSIEGVVESISDDGGLVLKVGNEKRTLYSGEVQIGNI